MITNVDSKNLYRKTFALSYSIPDITKKQLAIDLKKKLRHVTSLIIAEYSKKSPCLQIPVTEENEKKYLIWIELDRKRRFTKEDTFEIKGVRPSLKDHPKKTILEKIREKDTEPYQQGFDLDEKINSIKYKKDSKIAKYVDMIHRGEITPDEIRDKDTNVYVNNKRKLRELEDEMNSVRKKRRIEEGIMPPSKFKKVSIKKVKIYKDLKKIVRWYNFRLANQYWAKEASGLYIWSRDKNMGKTKFLYLLRKIDPNIYFWDKNDRGWQSKWDKKKDYSIIAFNAISNSKHVPYNVFEDFGDEESTITINKKFDATPDYISAKTPWILTANKPPEELYRGEDIEVILERCIVVELDGSLFELIDWIAEEHGLEASKPDKVFRDSSESSEEEE